MPHKRQGTLRNKIFTFMAIVSIAPILIAASLSVSSIYVSHRRDVANLEDALLHQKEAEILNFVMEHLEAMKFQTDIEQGGIPLPTQYFLLDQLLAAYPAFEEVAFISPSGIETVRVRKGAARSGETEVLRDVSRTERFMEVQRAGTYLGQAYVTLRGAIIPMAASVTDKQGKVIGYLSGEVNTSRLSSLMGDARLGETGYLYAVDKNGFMIVGTIRGKEPPAASLHNIGFIAQLLTGVNFLGFEGQRRYFSAAGEPVVGAGLMLKTLGWGLVVEWPIKEADAVITTLVNRNVLVTILVLVAAIAASLLLATLIVRPIKLLEEGTRRVAEGKLEHVVEIHTGDELEELGGAFNQMTKGLKELQQLKDEFVFIAAHELRTPVAAIKGYLSLIIDGTAGAIGGQAKDFIDKVMQANDRLIRLVNDLLEVARSEAGRLTIEVVPIAIEEPVRAVFSELKPLADEKKITLIYEPQSGLPQVMADTGRVKEVLVNLIGNAIKYTIGSGTVTVTHETKGDELITHIKDTGLGISQEAQKKLFEKFYRVQTDKTREITGTGLGLFIVKQIVEKMNGKIWVASEEGKGSTFSFSLPVAVQAGTTRP